MLVYDSEFHTKLARILLMVGNLALLRAQPRGGKQAGLPALGASWILHCK
jgi:hypothetical protein